MPRPRYALRCLPPLLARYFPRLLARLPARRLPSPRGGSPPALHVLSPSCTVRPTPTPGDDGRWRWQHIPVALLAGFKLTASALPSTATSAAAGSNTGVASTGGKGEVLGVVGARASAESRSSTVWSASVQPHVRLQVLTPLLGKIALKPSLDVLPRPALCIKRSFNVGTAKLSLRAKLQVLSHTLQCPCRLLITCLLFAA
ncbi:unnamed protein product [Closterium sp. NIES-54]